MRMTEELEQRLKNIEVEQERQDTVLNEFIRDLEEVLKLEAKLANIDNYEVPFFKKPPEEEPVEETPPPVPQGGFVIRLNFEPESNKAPIEWSDEAGGGWREYMMGTCYTTSEQANQHLRKLQKRWPDYPMEVVERSP